MWRKVPIALASCVLVLLVAAATELARATSAADSPSSSCAGGERLDGVSGAQWPSDWSWRHLGWRCILRYEDGRSDTVYFR